MFGKCLSVVVLCVCCMSCHRSEIVTRTTNWRNPYNERLSLELTTTQDVSSALGFVEEALTLVVRGERFPLAKRGHYRTQRVSWRSTTELEIHALKLREGGEPRLEEVSGVKLFWVVP